MNRLAYPDKKEIKPDFPPNFPRPSARLLECLLRTLDRRDFAQAMPLLDKFFRLARQDANEFSATFRYYERWDVISHHIHQVAEKLRLSELDDAAYQWDLRCVEQLMPPSGLDFYSLAVSSTKLGRFKEAFGALLKAFVYDVDTEADKRIFLHPGLDPLWVFLPTWEPSLREVFDFLPNLSSQRNRANCHDGIVNLIDETELARIHEDFHPLYQHALGPLYSFDQNHRLLETVAYRDFHYWTERMAAPRRSAFHSFITKIETVYDSHVPAMVRFCLDRERPGVAWHLLQCYAHRHPDTDPNIFSHITGLEFWMQEWRALWLADRHGLQNLLSHRADRHNREFMAEKFPLLPDKFRDSWLGWFIRSQDHFVLREYDKALAACYEALKLWPDNELLTSLRLEILHQQQNTEALREELTHPHLKRLDAWIVRRLCDPPWPHSEPKLWFSSPANLLFPTPAFGCKDKAVNEEFLCAMEQSPLTSAQMFTPQFLINT